MIEMGNTLVHSFQYKSFWLSKTKIVFTTRHEPKEKMKKCLEYPHSILERRLKRFHVFQKVSFSLGRVRGGPSRAKTCEGQVARRRQHVLFPLGLLDHEHGLCARGAAAEDNAAHGTQYGCRGPGEARQDLCAHRERQPGSGMRTHARLLM